LHEVLDTWFETVVKAHCRGRVILWRYADDFIIGCELEEEARRIKEVLPKRFAKYGLEINAEKTKLVDFGRPQRRTDGRKPGTFSFLGFVHYWGKTWRGTYTIKRKTEGKRLRRTLGEFWRWCRDHRHRPLQEQYATLCAKLCAQGIDTDALTGGQTRESPFDPAYDSRPSSAGRGRHQYDPCLVGTCVP
jgi:hypothetical protein